MGHRLPMGLGVLTALSGQVEVPAGPPCAVREPVAAASDQAFLLKVAQGRIDGPLAERDPTLGHVEDALDERQTVPLALCEGLQQSGTHGDRRIHAAHDNLSS